MINPVMSVKRQTISPMELPDFARDVITNDVNLRMGIAQIEQLARRSRLTTLLRRSSRGARPTS